MDNKENEVDIEAIQVNLDSEEAKDPDYERPNRYCSQTKMINPLELEIVSKANN